MFLVLRLRDIEPLSSITKQRQLALNPSPIGVHGEVDIRPFSFSFHWAFFGHEARYTDEKRSALIGYIGEFEIIDDHRSGKIVIQLNGRLNKTGVISPRFNVQANQIESWVNLLLPARAFGIIIMVRLPSVIHFVKLTTSLVPRPPPPVSWTTRRLVAKTLEASSSDTSTKNLRLSFYMYHYAVWGI